MKYIKHILFAGIICLFSCQQTNANIAPTISKKYSNEEIQNKIIAYKSSHHSDTYPSSILSKKFSNDFPNASDIDWETAANIYKVEFEIGRTDHEAYYDAQGELLMYTVELEEAELPAVVRNAIVTKYPDHKLDDIIKICRGSNTFYKVEVKQRKNDYIVIVSSNGTITDEYID